MSSRKTERQLDLLFILLNSSRALTRETIRQKIEEYRTQQSSEAFERMFERDKEELREIGVPIETKKLSSLFDDEYGYIVNIKDFGIQEATFNSSEMHELTRAALIWKDSLISSEARIGLVKNATSTGGEINLKQDFDLNEIVSDHIYIQMTEAVTHGLIAQFLYTKPKDEMSGLRRVFPMNLTTEGPFVYISGFDFKDNSIKNFNLSRVSGEIVTSKPSPQDLKQIKSGENLSKKDQQVKTALIQPLISPLALRHLLGGIEINGHIEIEYFDEENFAIFLAPYASDIKKIMPQSLSDLVIDQLRILSEKLK